MITDHCWVWAVPRLRNTGILMVAVCTSFESGGKQQLGVVGAD